MHQRIVPGSDDQHHAHRFKNHLRFFTHQNQRRFDFLIFQDFGSLIAEIIDAVANFEDFGAEGIEARFAGFAHDPVDDGFLMGNDICADFGNFTDARFQRHGCNFGLHRASTLIGSLDFLRGGGLHFVEQLAGCGVLYLNGHIFLLNFKPRSTRRTQRKIFENLSVRAVYARLGALRG